MSESIRTGALCLALLLWPGLSWAAMDSELEAMVRAEQPAVVETLRELVEIESGSRDLEGLGRIAHRIAVRLDALGGHTSRVLVPAEMVRFHDTPAEVGAVVVSRFVGRGTLRLLLLAHMDTVYPPGTLAARPWHIEGNRAYGPGVADDKSGIALILHALALLHRLGVDDYAELTVAINADEEIGSPGSQALIARLGAAHDVVLSCEPHPVGSDALAIATAGLASATLEIRGRAAHAGVEPEAGRNALIELAYQILRTNDLSRPADGIKFNWTLAQAGSARNVIPAHASATADVRVRRIEDYEAIERVFRERVAQPQTSGVDVIAGFERRRPPLEAVASNRAVAARARRLYAELGRTLHIDDRGIGGGTDAAFAARSGRPAVVEAFGLAGAGYHTSSDEYVEIDSIARRLYLLVALIRDLSRGAPASFR